MVIETFPKIKYIVLFSALSLFFTGICVALPLQQARSWAYWLQDIDLNQLGQSAYDINVIDYSSDGSTAEAFSAEQITALKNSSVNGKIVLCYLSIGEAEQGRFYFQASWVRNGKRTNRAPIWLNAPNSVFPDNFKVRFWKRAWQKIVFGVSSGANKSYLDRIMDANFDGVYLDIIDAFEDRKLLRVVENGRRRGIARNARDMARLVLRIASYARVTRGQADFSIFPQNGAGIIEHLPNSLRQQYFAAINGIGAEDTFYYGDNDENNALDPQTETIDLLDQYVSQAKIVLAIDYLTTAGDATNFGTLACAHNFLPQVSSRTLENLDFHRDLSCR